MDKSKNEIFRITSFLLAAVFIHAGCQLIEQKNVTPPQQQESNESGTGQTSSTINQINKMRLTTPSFENNGTMPRDFTCDGRGVNPPLKISEVPAGTKSLALIVDDPDASSGDWVHWLLWNISPGNTDIIEDSIPLGATQGTTSYGKPGWGSPCPPNGTHRYFFKIYALDTEISLNSKAKKSDLLEAMNGHILERTELVGLYKR